ncbi:SnoaL-like polyketide cyclase [compost metagenome]
MKTVYFLLGINMITVFTYAQTVSKSNSVTINKEVEMSTIENNKETVRQLYENALNKKDFESLKIYVSNDYTGPTGAKGPLGFEEPIKALFTAFPDIHWNLEDLIAEDNKVVVKWNWKGTHSGQFTTFVATGKQITASGIAIYHLRNGKVISTTIHTDRLGFLQQIDALPDDLTLLSNDPANEVQFIDKFLVPAAAKKEFYDRVNINRNFIKKLPGFIRDNVYEYIDENGNTICITIALWKNKEALSAAKTAVQEEYKKTGFDPAEMFKRLNISADRGVYKELITE